MKHRPSILLVLALVTGCSSRNPRYCGDGICSDPAFPYCDLDGSLGGKPQTCIAVSCTPGDFAECLNNQAVVCNASGTDYDVTTCEHGCDPASMGCVGCIDDSQCMNPTPHCDPQTRECKGCVTDDQCPSTVCDHDTGACLAASTILYASPTGATTGACGMQQTPCSFAHVFELLDLTHTTIRLVPGTYQVSNLTVLPGLVSSGQSAVVYGAAAILKLNDTSISVQGGHLVMHDMEIQQLGNSEVIDCGTVQVPSGSLDVIGVAISTGISAAVNAYSCDVTITGSALTGPLVGPRAPLVSAAGITSSHVTIDKTVFRNSQAISGSGRITNSVFVNAQDPTYGAVLGDVDVSFSTFIDSPIVSAACATNFGASSYSNDIMISTGSSVAPTSTAPNCSFHYDLMMPQPTAPPVSDHLLLNVSAKFRDSTGGDYHLVSSSTAIDAADPNATLDHDFDGVARPQGARRDMGAFEYKP